jgi:exoribonuclease-2
VTVPVQLTRLAWELFNVDGPDIDLRSAAIELLRAHGFQPDLPEPAQRQLSALLSHPPEVAPTATIQDLRHLAWSSIDNDTSRDLDQLEVAETLPGGETKVRVAIADVDAFVPRASPLDDHAAFEGTTVYAEVETFPMLPEPLSTDRTSLREGQDRLSLVVEFVVGTDGAVGNGDVYRAVVCNQAQLTYGAVGAWLEQAGPMPEKVAASAELQSQIAMQDRSAQALRSARFRHGALNIETIETHPVQVHNRIVGIAEQQKNRAMMLIEDFMIATNEAVARCLASKRVSSIRRVVRTPARWSRIVDLARGEGVTLPPEPDSKALNDFLTARKAADPDRFADLSLAIIKLLGPGEYVLERPGDPDMGHFGLAVQNYTHSTAPNRRFADLLTQRVLKAALDNAAIPYTDDELAAIAQQCTIKEDAARKVEREMSKRIAAVAMSGRIGESFDAMVTGVTPRGTFVRVLRPHVEGLLVRGAQGADVGDRVRVTLVQVDPQRGFIDFARQR